MLRLLVAVTAMALIYRLMRREQTPEPRYIRDAGRSQMRNPPRDWEMLDEIGDESFPASDPPATY